MEKEHWGHTCNNLGDKNLNFSGAERTGRREGELDWLQGMKTKQYMVLIPEGELDWLQGMKTKQYMVLIPNDWERGNGCGKVADLGLHIQIS